MTVERLAPIDHPLLAGLNDRQREAVTHGEGPLLVVAGAGSGKTRVITRRIAHLIASGAPASSIFAVTFTNKAAGEMKERVARMLGGAKVPVVSTFHSFCTRFLRAHLGRADGSLTGRFSVLDSDDTRALVKSVLRELKIDDKNFTPQRAASAISAAKNRGQGAEGYAASAGNDERRRTIARVFELYEERKRRANALDFDDLLIETARLLAGDDHLRAAYNARFRHILVDEYQDTNSPQLELLRLLAERRPQNVCAVGDGDQQVYSFRGANQKTMAAFERQFPGTVVVRLERNYRSSGAILEAANALIRHNTDRMEKTLWTDRGRGEPVLLHEADTGEDEARWVARRVAALAAECREERVAVLYRTNAQSRLMEEALRRERVAYRLVGGFSFYARAEVRDAVAYLKLALNPNDDLALFRVLNTPRRGLGEAARAAIDAEARALGVSRWEALVRIVDCPPGGLRCYGALRAFRELVEEFRAGVYSKPLSALVRMAVVRTGLVDELKKDRSEEGESRVANLHELLGAAAEAEEAGDDLTAFVDQAALASDTDDLDRDAQVTLLTAHSAKGLEFPVVFVVGLEEDLFPHERSVHERADLEEERRLFYVAVTRAERRLYLTRARYRRRFDGKGGVTIPSRFLAELPKDLLAKA